MGNNLNADVPKSYPASPFHTFIVTIDDRISNKMYK